MSNNLIAVIDLETTGLSPWRHDRVVEIAIVVMSPEGKVQFEYETLVNPNRDIGPTQIHHIFAKDVLSAPTFAEVAGDIWEILTDASVIAGHNVSFDRNFLTKEYERIGVIVPDVPMLCTFRLLGRNSLLGCCEELGIVLDGMPHRALTDARATAKIVSFLCADDPLILAEHQLKNVPWPAIPALHTPCYCREHANRALEKPPPFLQRIASKIHHDTEAETPSMLAYLALIDRVIEDRTINQNEENLIVDAALRWGLSAHQLNSAHLQYMQNLAVIALADGVVTDSELRDLHAVANLLGQDDSSLDAMLASAAEQLNCALPPSATTQLGINLGNQRVCFTGELQCAIRGQLISRQIAEALATQAGLTVASTVTKKLDLLVVADPHTQSSKAKKAREYGIRILAEPVFWKMVGVTVD